MKACTLITTSIFCLTLSLAGNAQTYTVSSNNQSWSSLVSGTCNNCTINIPAGWTLLLNSNGTCNGCTFNGGTVKITSSFTFNNAATNFNNDTVLINTAATFYNVNFNNDSVAANSTINSQNGTSTVDHTRMKVNANVTFNAANFTNDSIHINNVTFHTNNTPANFTNSFVEVAGNSGAITTPGSTFTGSNVVFSNNSSMTLDNSFVSTGSNFTMHDGSTIKSNGTTSIKSSSKIVMDGTNNSFTAANALPVDSSTITMNSTSTLKGSSLTLTNSAITGTGGTIKSDNAITISNSSLTTTGATIKGSSFTATSSTVDLGTGSTLTSDNAITLTGTTFTADAATIKGSSITAQTNSNVTISGASSVKSDNAITVTGSTLTTSGSTAITASSFTAQTNSTVNMSGTSNLTTDNAIDIKASYMKLSGNAWANAKGSFIIESAGKVIVGDGTSASTAHIMTNNSLQVTGGSFLGIVGGNNYLFTSANTYSDGSTSYNIKTNTISCGSGHPNACSSGYVYGCATLNNSGAVGCVTLALAAPELSAHISNGQVLLSWQIKAGSNADRFLIQRSANGADWSLAGEVVVNDLTSAYTMQDAQAQAGTNYYRLQQVDRDGHSALSPVTSVKMDIVIGQTAIFPNPVKGHTFFLKTPSTDAVILKVFTVSGQPLLLSALKGQTQYSVQLPATAVSNTCLIVQVIGNGLTQSFTLLAQ